MRNLIKLAAVVAIGLSTLSAWAVPFTATIPDQVGPISGTYFIGGVTSPGTSAVGGAHLTFDLIGYGGIDGYGGRINTNDVYDTFGFRLNDDFFGAILNMGGANPGPAVLYGNTFPSLTLVSYTDNGSGRGGLASFSVDFTLLSGANSFGFNYGCCSLANGSEEGWGLRNIAVSADLLGTRQPVTSVPEPETYALMLAGLGVMGAVVRRRKVLQA